MKIQFMLVGLFAIILLAISPYGLASSDHRLVFEDNNIDDAPILKREADAPNNETDLNSTSIAGTTPIITTKTSAENITTAIVEITTTPAIETSTSANLITTPTPSPITSSTTTSVATATSPITAESSTTSPKTAESSTTSTAAKQLPITEAPGRKFDAASFIGGMILAIGLGALIYLVVRYLRRSNRLPYANLR